jgi:hypothetical protein
MAAITKFDTKGMGSLYILRNVTAQSGAGQTDWVSPPEWATNAIVHLSLTAVAGTTPEFDLVILDANPVLKDDGSVENFAGWDGITQLTDADEIIIYIGPGITGIADDDTAAVYKINSPLSPLMGFKVTLDDTTGDEEYDYSLSISWRR